MARPGDSLILHSSLSDLPQFCPTRFVRCRYGDGRYSNDQVDQVLGHLFSGRAVFHAEVCSWLLEVNRGQRFLANLILLCGYHHRFLHEHGWIIEDSPDGKPVFRIPDGQIYPPPRPGLDPRIRELVRSHRT